MKETAAIIAARKRIEDAYAEYYKVVGNSPLENASREYMLKDYHLAKYEHQLAVSEAERYEAMEALSVARGKYLELLADSVKE